MFVTHEVYNSRKNTDYRRLIQRNNCSDLYLLRVIIRHTRFQKKCSDAYKFVR